VDYYKSLDKQCQELAKVVESYDHSFCASFLSLELTPKVIFKVFTAIS
jgi:hypothetical protein